jgi:hypothetical protein
MRPTHPRIQSVLGENLPGLNDLIRNPYLLLWYSKCHCRKQVLNKKIGILKIEKAKIIS